MATKRPNKQQRQRQNRQQREARRARSVHAGEATAIARGERQSAEPTASTRASGKGTAAKAAPAKGGRRGRYSIPGQRAVVMAFLFTIVSAVTLLVSTVPFQREVEADDPVLETIAEEDQEETDEGTVTYVEDSKLVDEEEPAVVAGVLLTPILITGAAVWFAKRPQRSMVWTMAMIAMAAYVFFIAGAAYGTLALPALVALAIGGFQSRRAESKERLAELRAKKAAATDGEVIDASATETEPDDQPDDASAEPVDDEDRR